MTCGCKGTARRVSRSRRGRPRKTMMQKLRTIKRKRTLKGSKSRKGSRRRRKAKY
jgi:hypothetical protein